jgi:hypothetical protein
MSKLDSLKEKINILRDDYRNMFIFFMAVLTGSFTIFFQVVVGQITILFTFIGIVGVVVSLFTLLKMKKIKFDIDLLIEELGDLDE